MRHPDLPQLTALYPDKLALILATITGNVIAMGGAR
jgi:hypothetical protein